MRRVEEGGKERENCESVVDVEEGRVQEESKRMKKTSTSKRMRTC